MGIVVEVGRRAIGRLYGYKVLMLPALRVINPHRCYGLAWAVGVGKLHGELHNTLGRKYRCAVALRAFNIVLAEVYNNVVATLDEGCPILYGTEIL
jgi:hypothetical protein